MENKILGNFIFHLSWFNRGGNYDKSYAGLFDVNSYYGGGTDNVVFRSAIS